MPRRLLATHQSVLAARLIVVGQDHDISTREGRSVFGAPLVRAAGGARRGNAEFAERVDGLLAFGKENSSACCDSGLYLRKMVDDALDSAHLP